jgi:hypothetical protein
MSIAIEPEDTVYLDVQNLRHEYGWHEVAKGLNRILLGYFILLVGFVILGVSFGLLAAGLATKHKDKSLALLFEVLCLVGALAVCALSLWSYKIILWAKWRCLKHCPERCGAKWMIFACIIGIAMGPAMNFFCSMGGVKRSAVLSKGPQGFKMPEFDTSTRYMQAACSSIALASWALFMGFLRAAANCFNDRARAFQVFLWLCFFGLLWVSTFFLVFANPRLLFQPVVLLWLGLGWILAFIWHLLLIFLVRCSITYRLELIQQPL